MNVYAYIWQNLRRQPLDEMALIATDFPEAVKDALDHGNEQELDYALSCWQPVVPITIDPRHVEQTVKDFGEVVDEIEEGRFAPPLLDILNTPLAGTRNVRFGTHVCRNCDARFSCASYRQYAWQGRSIADRSAMQYYVETLSDAEQEAWRAANLDATPDALDLSADYFRR